MKKLLISGLVFAFALSGGVAFAKGKVSKKKDAPKKWECSMGDTKVMTATVDECLKKGGLVMNYPGPEPAKAAPAKKKAKKK